MKKYRVTFPLYTSVTFEVEANNEDEALEIANNMEYDMDQLLDNMVPYEHEEIQEIN